jgi:CheY-like chemotaxis protein
VSSEVPTEVVGDPHRLRQILTNVVGNAVKFTERGRVSFRVSLDDASDGQPRVCFEIADTGIGMTEGQIDRLFTPFVQADGSTTRRFGGTGLGLAITSDLITRMGGRIEVQSRVGFGSRFVIRLPFTQPEHDPDQIDPSSLRGRRILVITKSAADLAMLTHEGGQWGIRFEWIGDGGRAHERLAKARIDGHPFDAVVLEPEMVERDGRPLLDAFRSLPEMSHLPVLLLSAETPRTPEAIPMAANWAHLVKPVRRASLQRTLCRLLTQRDGNESPRPPTHPPGDPMGRVLRILLAEDNPINQQVAHRMLKKLGLQVDVAENGANAIERLADQTYDAVLMDMQMPILDGVEATRRWREREDREGRPRTPIIAMTANAMASDREACLAAGMDDYLAKPITLAALDDILRRWVAPHAPFARTPGSGSDDGGARC